MYDWKKNFLFEFKRKLIKDRKIRKHIKDNFPNELLLMNNKHTSHITHTSILYFTVQRCASRYIMNIINDLISDSDMTYIDIEGYFWRGGESKAEPSELYKNTGYIYGPFYGMDKEELTIPIPNLDNFKIFLILRDPRDVLTSYYFHHAYDPYDNPAQQEYILERSRDALSKSIDDWVLEKAPIYNLRYKEYIDKFLHKPNLLFLKYEDMISDFDIWLKKLIKFIDLPVSDRTIESIINKANFSVDNENVKSHKRQVTPGDHKRKLQGKTIDLLNLQFKEVLEKFNYEMDK